MDIAEEFLKIFTCQDGYYGEANLIGSKSDQGKSKTNNKAFHLQVTKRNFETHLQGNTLAVIPGDGEKSTWGVIDFDVYDNPEVIMAIISNVFRYDLPLIPIYTKSKGLHLYYFCSVAKKYSLLKTTFQKIIESLGFTKTDTKPIEYSIKLKDKEYRFSTSKIELFIDRAITLPYDGFETARYAINKNLEAIPIEEFLVQIQINKYRDINLALFGLQMPAKEDLPFCLQYIIENPNYDSTHDKFRGYNSVVHKHMDLNNKNPDFRKEIIKYAAYIFNQKPKDKQAETQILQSTVTKFNLDCERLVVACGICDKDKCMTFKYGVNSRLDTTSPFYMKDIKKFDTDPVSWLITMFDNKGQLKEFKVTTEELTDYKQFSKKCFEQLLLQKPNIKNMEWRDHLVNITHDVELIALHEQLSDENQTLFILKKICQNIAFNTELMDLYNNRPINLDNCYWFTSQCIKESIARFNIKRPFEKIIMIIANMYKQEKLKEDTFEYKGQLFKAYGINSIDLIKVQDEAIDILKDSPI